MTTYRTAGAWGAGKGANLVASEVDENFYGLVQRVTNVEDNPALPVSIASVTVSGQYFTVHYTNASSSGPFLLPVAQMTWRGDWAPTTLYHPFDLLFQLGAGLYMVTSEFTSGTTFDDTVDTSDGPALAKMIGLIPGSEISIFSYAVNHDLTLSEAGGYVRFTGSTPRTLTVPSHTDVEFDIGTIVTVRQADTGSISIVGGAGVTINTPLDCIATLRGHGSTATLIQVATNVWDAAGDLAIEGTE